MRRVKVKSPEQAAYLAEVRKDFNRYLKSLNQVSGPEEQRLQARVLVEITCPICKALFADTVDAEKWAEGSAWVWCKQPGHRHEIKQSEGTMERVKSIQATWCAGVYFTLGMQVNWVHRKVNHHGELAAIAAPYQDVHWLVPRDTPKSRLKLHAKNEHGYRAVLKSKEGAKLVYYVVSLNSCSLALNSSSQIS